MLTDTAIRRLRPGDRQFKVSDGHGLYLLVLPSGGRYWRMDYRFAEKRCTLALGVYPDVSLKEARDKLSSARKLLEKGIDPAAYRRLTRGVGEMSGDHRFKAVADEWLGKMEAEGRSATTLKKMRWLLSFAEPFIGNRPVGEISAPELLNVLRTVEKRGRYETARRLRSTCGTVIRYGIATGRADRDVTQDLQGSLITPKVNHYASIIEPSQVGELLRAIDGYEGQPQVRMALLIAPYVFVRPGELRTAEWSEFDLDAGVWTIPGPKMKTRRPHKVPLSRQVIELLQELAEFEDLSNHLFPSIRDKNRPMSNNTLNAALRRLGYDKTEMTPHGFRAMASSLLNESRKWHPDAIERQLAHVECNDVRRAYARGEHWDERVKMMQFWADYLDTLKDRGKVLRTNFGHRR